MPKIKLSQLFKETPEREYIKADNLRKPLSKNSTYTIYPLSEFNELKQAVESKSIKGAKTDRYRYLVDTSGKLWLAAEGTASNTIPAHFQLTGEPNASACCLSAGNFKFEGNKLISINNKSGDFEPPFASLFHVLIILANTEHLPFEISDFLIEDQRKLGTSGFMPYEIEINDFMAWGAKHRDMVKDQPQEITVREYPGMMSRRPSLFHSAGVDASDKTYKRQRSGSRLFSPIALFAQKEEDEKVSPSVKNQTREKLPFFTLRKESLSNSDESDSPFKRPRTAANRYKENEDKALPGIPKLQF